MFRFINKYKYIFNIIKIINYFIFPNENLIIYCDNGRTSILSEYEKSQQIMFNFGPILPRHGSYTHGFQKTLPRTLASHSCRMGIINDDTCKKYREVNMRETLKHLLRFCPALVKTRLRYLGTSQFKGLAEVSEYRYQRSIKFHKKR